MPRVVAVDAIVLYSAALRNLVLWLRVKEVIHLHWTREIDDEWIRNLAKNRGVPPNKFLHGVAALMKDVAPDWEIDGFEGYIGRFKGVDENDQHVAAAAYKLSLEEWPDASPAEHGNAERTAGGVQFLIERGQRQAEPLRQFEIGCVIEREPTAFRQVQRGRPRLMIGLGIDGNHERTQIRDRSVAERRADPIAPYRHLQRIGDFQPPVRWSNRA